MYRKFCTVDYPRRTIELRETTNHPASSYGQPVLVDRNGNAYDRWMVIPIEPKPEGDQTETGGADE